jgi:hypothetical protein
MKAQRPTQAEAQSYSSPYSAPLCVLALLLLGLLVKLGPAIQMLHAHN